RDFRMEAPAAFKQQLGNLLDFYLELKEALVEGEPTTAASARFSAKLEAVSEEGLQGEALDFWTVRKSAMGAAIANIQASASLEEQRQFFISLSEEMIKTLLVFGLNNQTIFVDYCPMANSDKGAYWLSDLENIRNPYYGDAMLTCGEIVREIN